MSSGRCEDDHLNKRKCMQPWSLRCYLVIAGCLVAGVLLIQIEIIHLNDERTYSGWGNGFGIANTLMSALAFVALVITLKMQSQELELQREELGYTREELKGSRQAQEDLVQLNIQASRISGLTAILNQSQQELTMLENERPEQGSSAGSHLFYSIKQKERRPRLIRQITVLRDQIHAQLIITRFSYDRNRCISELLQYLNKIINSNLPNVVWVVASPLPVANENLEIIYSKTERVLEDIRKGLAYTTIESKAQKAEEDPFAPIIEAILFDVLENTRMAMARAKMADPGFPAGA